MPANPCSVLQGSKLSSLLYVIYCNEIPLLRNLVGSQNMTQLTDKQYTVDTTNITHNTIQYVDNSTNQLYNLLDYSGGDSAGKSATIKLCP